MINHYIILTKKLDFLSYISVVDSIGLASTRFDV